METVLRDKTAPREKKVEALRLLVHFVGDVHQPLHVGQGTDRGGNWCAVKWFGRATNLHAVWDKEMIDSSQLSYTEYAQFLDRASPEEIRRWQQGAHVDWANESQVLLSQGVYPDTEAVAPHGERPYCKRIPEETIPEGQQPRLDYTYLRQHVRTVEQRMLQAGIRFAGRLNDIYK